jgi:hypothetical protein
MTDQSAAELQIINDTLQSILSVMRVLADAKSCRTCKALVLDRNMDAHVAWHIRSSH